MDKSFGLKTHTLHFDKFFNYPSTNVQEQIFRLHTYPNFEWSDYPSRVHFEWIN